jgi:hypothetical protein
MGTLLLVGIRVLLGRTGCPNSNLKILSRFVLAIEIVFNINIETFF